MFRRSRCPLGARVVVRGVKVGVSGDIRLAAASADAGEETHVSEHVGALPSGKMSGSIWQTDAQPERGLSLAWRAQLRQVLVHLAAVWALGFAVLGRRGLLEADKLL